MNSPELTRLHRLTDTEADLVLSFHLLSPAVQGAIAMMISGNVASHPPTAMW